jgi:endonuclease-3 related protein
LSAFGPRGWWPVTPRGGREPVYRPGRSRPLSSREREEVCVGAILTQNTAWTNVTRALSSLHAAGVWTLEDVARLPATRLERLIRSSGYFRQKARKLKVFALRASERGGLSRWLAGPLPELREELLSLWGVGPETADSILLYAGGREAVVVDAYTLRIGRRLGWHGPGAGYDAARRRLELGLARRSGDQGELHALFVELAKRHCRKSSPDCGGCPLSSVCARRGVGRRS